ncbi:MAG: ABC transporter ATP-binding protein/permease [Propionibacteriaceae bacterium]|jgi:ABC-type multidrug transport system fused ATPase/permease subunit|nr:ABC transporter ATP-binding protein/permease [Propionibacteriaceae bacterium]
MTAPLTTHQIRRRLLRIALPALDPLVFSLAFRVVGLGCGIALFASAGAAVGEWADHHRGARPGSSPWPEIYIAILVIFSLVKGVSRYLEQYFGHRVAFGVLAHLRVLFYQRLAPQSPAGVLGRRAGDLVARATRDIDRVEVFFAHTLVPVIAAVVVPVLTVVGMAFFVDPVAALVLAAGLAVNGAVVPRLGARSTRQAARRIRDSRGLIAQHVADSVQGVRDVLAFQAENLRLDELLHWEEPVATGLTSNGRWIARRRGIAVFVQAATLIGVLLVLLARLDPLWLSTLGLGLGIAVSAFAPVTAIEDVAADLDEADAAARRVLEIFDAAPIVADPAEAPLPIPTAGAPEIRFDDVSFAYPTVEGLGERRPGDGVASTQITDRSEGTLPDGGSATGDAASWTPFPTGSTTMSPRPVLDHLTFTAEAGKVTAVVGASGSGKSTIAALVTRSWDPDSGTITLGNHNLRDYPLAQLRDLVGLSQQRPYLFNSTIAANMRLAKEDATLLDLETAAARASLTEFIAAEPEGWQTPVGEMGERLSGGQRQRLALAQVMLREPRVLILDEATSQLDAATEEAVLSQILRAARGSTVLMIAHRLATVRDADTIIVLDNGRIVEEGTYDELAQAGGPFAALLSREN